MVHMVDGGTWNMDGVERVIDPGYTRSIVELLSIVIISKV